MATINRYHSGKIYKLVNSVDDKKYIGSTCMRLSKRLHDHKSKAKRCLTRTVYQHLNTIGWENVRIILIEDYKCESKNELEKKEYEHILLNKDDNLLNNKIYKNSKCPHNRQASQCKECPNASAICIHNNRKSLCKDCPNSTGICSHNRNKYECKECPNASGICEHNRNKSYCKECPNSIGICEHNRDKRTCKECPNASGICEHNKRKTCCKECPNASGICEHNRQKRSCKECPNARGICEHNKRKTCCKECNNDKYYCYECELNFAGNSTLKKHTNSKKHKNTYDKLIKKMLE